MTASASTSIFLPRETLLVVLPASNGRDTTAADAYFPLPDIALRVQLRIARLLLSHESRSMHAMWCICVAYPHALCCLLLQSLISLHAKSPSVQTNCANLCGYAKRIQLLVAAAWEVCGQLTQICNLQ